MLGGRPARRIAHQPVRQGRAGDKDDALSRRRRGVPDRLADPVALVEIGEDAGAHRHHGNALRRVEVLQRHECAVIPFVVRGLVAAGEEALALDRIDQSRAEFGVARPVVGHARDQVGQLVGDADAVMPPLASDVPGEGRDPMRRLQHDHVRLERLDRAAHRVLAGDDPAQEIGGLGLDADPRRMRGDGAHDNAAGHALLLLAPP